MPRLSPLRGAPPQILTRFAWSQVPFTNVQGGKFKITDSTTFTISKTIAAAEVMVEVGGMREMHVSFCHVDSASVVSEFMLSSGTPLSRNGASFCSSCASTYSVYSHLMDSGSSGSARMTIFTGGSRARTYNYAVRFQS